MAWILDTGCWIMLGRLLYYIQYCSTHRSVQVLTEAMCTLLHTHTDLHHPKSSLLEFEREKGFH